MGGVGGSGGVWGTRVGCGGTPVGKALKPVEMSPLSPETKYFSRLSHPEKINDPERETRISSKTFCVTLTNQPSLAPDKLLPGF